MSNVKNVLVLGSSGVGKENWMRNLTGQSFQPQYVPLENVHQQNITHGGVILDICIVPGQMPYLTEQCITIHQPDCILIFVDVTSRLSNKKGMKWKRMMENRNIPVHIVYNKMDVQGYGNKLDEMVESLPISEYSVISGRFGTNVCSPLSFCANV